MFIEGSANSKTTPFGGAEFNWTFTTQEPFRSSEWRWGAFVLLDL